MPRHKRLEQEEWEQAVLATFMPAGRLLSLPARRKKRMVVLRWLAELFRPARRYTEAEVNEVLGRYHEDFASLRRFLVDEELLQRQAGVYWRAGTMPYPQPAGPGTPTGGSVALTGHRARADLSEPETTDELERLLAAEDRLVLVAFLDPGCEPCRELRRQLEDLAAERRDVCAVALVDASRNPEAAAKFQIGVFPTLVFIKRGTELRRFKGGALPPSTLRLLQ